MIKRIRIVILLSWCLICIFLNACGISNKQDSEMKVSKKAIIGTWRLYNIENGKRITTSPDGNWYEEYVFLKNGRGYLNMGIMRKEFVYRFINNERIEITGEGEKPHIRVLRLPAKDELEMMKPEENYIFHYQRQK